MTAYISLGYTVTRPVEREHWMNENLPSRILSFSECIAPHIPNGSLVDVTRGVSRAIQELEIGESTAIRLHSMLERQFQKTWFWPRHLVCMATAREILTVLHEESRDWLILEVFAEESSRQELLETIDGSSPHRLDGDWLRTATPQAPGPILGFEVYNIWEGHSWHCHDLSSTVEQHLGFRVGAWGLLPDLEQARQATQWIAQEAVTDKGPWISIALCQVT